MSSRSHAGLLRLAVPIVSAVALGAAVLLRPSEPFDFHRARPLRAPAPSWPTVDDPGTSGDRWKPVTPEPSVIDVDAESRSAELHGPSIRAMDWIASSAGLPADLPSHEVVNKVFGLAEQPISEEEFNRLQRIASGEVEPDAEGRIRVP